MTSRCSIRWSVIESTEEMTVASFDHAPAEREYTAGHLGDLYHPVTLRYEPRFARLFLNGEKLTRVEGLSTIPVVSYYNLRDWADIDALPMWARDVVLWLWNTDLGGPA